jgi:hypothetical protein
MLASEVMPAAAQAMWLWRKRINDWSADRRHTEVRVKIIPTSQEATYSRGCARNVPAELEDFFWEGRCIQKLWRGFLFGSEDNTVLSKQSNTGTSMVDALEGIFNLIQAAWIQEQQDRETSVRKVEEWNESMHQRDHAATMMHDKRNERDLDCSEQCRKYAPSGEKIVVRVSYRCAWCKQVSKNMKIAHGLWQIKK